MSTPPLTNGNAPENVSEIVPANPSFILLLKIIIANFINKISTVDITTFKKFQGNNIMDSCTEDATHTEILKLPKVITHIKDSLTSLNMLMIKF